MLMNDNHQAKQIVYMTMTQAAKYAGVSKGLVGNHVYTLSKLIPAAWIGNHPGFTREQMDAFKNREKSKGGRPKKES